MQGGLFGLNKCQQLYLYTSLLVPTIVVLWQKDLITSMVITQIFYVVVSDVYIRWLSLEKSYFPYLSSELGKLKWQVEKGMVLGISAFLLIAIYGIIFMKLGKVVLPHSVHLGHTFLLYWPMLMVLSVINPILEEWYWRLFLPKTLQSTYYESHVINITYLMYHLALFGWYVGFWRAVPLVGTFFSVGRSMSHIKQKYGIVSSIIAHYGITCGGFVLYLYLRYLTNTQFV